MTTNFLDRPTGRLAYELTGDPNGPLVVLSPGMGDLRSTFDGLAERLAAEGARVVNAHLRGHGESSTGWDGYGVSAVADDLLALLHAHGGRGVLVGNSYSGSAAVVAAAREPEAVTGLVLPARSSATASGPCCRRRFRALPPRVPGPSTVDGDGLAFVLQAQAGQLRGPQGRARGEPQASARLRRARPDDHGRGHPPEHHAAAADRARAGAW